MLRTFRRRAQAAPRRQRKRVLAKSYGIASVVLMQVTIWSAVFYTLLLL